MADRFPLILNTSNNQIQEIASGDQLDLSGNNVANAGIITATTFSGNLTGNVTGNINGNLTGTLQTAAQPNITSLGTLSSLNVSGNASIGGVLTYEDVTNVDSVGIITARDDIKITTDNKSITMGAGADLSMKHDGTNSYILNNTGSFVISADTVQFNNRANNETKAKLINNGAVELYHNGVKQLETRSDGLQVDGTVRLPADNSKLLFGAGLDLEIFHSGSHSIIRDAGTGTLRIEASEVGILSADGSETMAQFVQNGAVSLRYDNNTRLETTSSGVALTGNLELGDNERIVLGDAGTSDSHIRWDTSHLQIASAGQARFSCSGLSVVNLAGTETQLITAENGGVELYHDNSKKLETTSIGLTIYGDVKIIDNENLRLGTDNDMLLYHTGSHGYIENGTGNMYIRGGGGQILMRANSAEDSIVLKPDGAVELFHNNIKLFETASGGCKSSIAGANTFTIGSTDASGAYLVLDGDSNGDGGGSDYCSIIHGTDGDLSIHADNPNGDSQFELYTGSGSTTAIVAQAAGEVQLYHNGSQKFNTASFGATVTGTFQATGNIDLFDNGVLNIGTGADLKLYHDATNSRIDNDTGVLYIRNNTGTYNGNPIQIQALATENSIVCNPNGAVKLYNDNNPKLETTSTGIAITGQAVATGNSAKFQAVESGGATVEIRCGGNEGYIGTQTGHKISFITSGNRTMTLLANKELCIGLKGTTGDTSHTSTIGWTMSDGWTKGVFNGSVGGNTPWTLYNLNGSYNRYMAYIKFDGGFANYQSNDTNLCDERVKKDFAEVPSQWNNIKNIGFKHFRYKEDSSSEPLKIGVVAQQVEPIYPDLVDEDWPQGDANPNTHEKNTGDFYKSVKEEQLLMYSVKALQEAMAKIETLEAEVAALKGS